jgi:hypothetical protein
LNSLDWRALLESTIEAAIEAVTIGVEVGAGKSNSSLRLGMWSNRLTKMMFSLCLSWL